MIPPGARRALWWCGWLAVGGLLVWSAAPDRPSGAGARPLAPTERLLGSFAGLAASVLWVRFDLALRRGDTARAYARAETALRIDPGDPRGWIFLARHLAYERGSVLREPDRDARARWIEAALGTLRRGEGLARDPGPLRFERGVVLAFQASLADEDRAFPRGEREAWDRAAEAFEEAAAAGAPDAAAAAVLARERAAVAPPGR